MAPTSGGFRGGAMGRSHPPSRKFFRFFLAKVNEKQVHTTSDASQNVFLPMIAPPSKILDPPLAPTSMKSSLYSLRDTEKLREGE
jgi:hypothetical protein